MKNSHKPRGTYSDYLNRQDVAIDGKIFVFQLSKDNRNNQTMTTDTGAPIPFPLSVTIPMTGTVYHKGVNGAVAPRKIRYVEGENSIYVDEQSPDKDVPKTKVVASFVRGRMQVDGRNSTMLDFMMNWDINGTKKDRDEKKISKFHLVDTSKLVEKSRKADKDKFAAAQWCYDAPLDKVLAVASLRLSDEQMVQPAEDIRWNLKLIAERNPEEFLKMLENPSTERRYIMKKAINDGFVVINTQINAICWSDNANNPMTVAPAGKDPLEDFITKSFSTDGERYYRAIEALVNPSAPVKEQVSPGAETSQTNEIPSEVKPSVQATGVTDGELKMLINAGVEKGVVTISSTRLWWTYRGSNFKLEAGMIQALRDNATMLSLLKKDVL
jgi:hypothetical protein